MSKWLIGLDFLKMFRISAYGVPYSVLSYFTNSAMLFSYTLLERLVTRLTKSWYVALHN